MDRLKDKWLRLIGVPLVAIMANFIFYDVDNSLNNISRVKAITFSLLECVLLWEVCRRIIISARKRFPQLKQTASRVIFQTVWLIVITVVLRLALTFAYDKTEFWGYAISIRSYWINVLTPFLFTVPIFVIYEARFLYHQWWTTYYEAEQLKKENLQSQLESLKSQINPHFLFNSLSTLSSLVSEDPKRAEWFIDELSAVYRYLLQTNAQTLNTLEQEMGFVRAYFNLLKTRFGDGLEWELAIQKRHLHWLLPPLTLQLLIENAVKHNIVSPKQPLLIRIYTDDNNGLFVVNSLQKKINAGPSSGTGLNNISKKFQLLKQPEILVQETATSFLVMVPLMNGVSYEGINY